MDITDHQNLGKLNAQRLHANFVSSTLTVNAKSAVEAMTADLDTEHLRKDIAHLSSFWNRNYRSPWGLASSNWIYQQVEQVI